MNAHHPFQKRYVRLLLFCAVYFYCEIGNAQFFNYKTTESSAILAASDIEAHGLPDTLTVWCADWDFITSNPSTWGNSMKLKSNNTFVKFLVNNYYSITSYLSVFNYTFRLTYDIYGYTDPSDTTASTTHYRLNKDTLTITYNNSSINTPYQDLHFKKYSNFYKAVIVVTGIYQDSAGAIVPVNLSNIINLNFQVEGSILTQRYDKGEYGAGTDPLITMAFPNETNNYLDLYWNYTSGDTTPIQLTPINFELEWTYIDDYLRDIGSGAISSVPSSSVSFDFLHNCTRVWTDSNHYRIPLIYQEGYVAFRVCSAKPDSSYFEYPIYGDWSLSSSSGYISAIPSSCYYYKSNSYMHDSLNWDYTISFAEGGKYKHALSFYDGLLKNRQTITRFNSNPNNLIAVQNFYDFEGRPSIKTLPSPVNSTAFSYVHNVAIDSITNAPYKPIDFDTSYAICPDFQVVSPLALNSLARVYYSGENPDTSGVQKFVPDAQGYPIIQTVLQPGYNDRIQRLGGPGAALQIGNSNFITNYYVGANQAALNSLFGSDVGWESYYTMTVTRDANQQLSMGIKDYEGKQIASAMIGTGPNPTDHAITSVDAPPSQTVHEDLLYGTPQEIVGFTKTASYN